MENYTFEQMWLDLKNGYQIYYTYVGNRYLLFKTAENCYTQKLLSEHKKNPQPRMLMLTLKRVREIKLCIYGERKGFSKKNKRKFESRM